MPNNYFYIPHIFHNEKRLRKAKLAGHLKDGISAVAIMYNRISIIMSQLLNILATSTHKRENMFGLFFCLDRWDFRMWQHPFPQKRFDETQTAPLQLTDTLIFGVEKSEMAEQERRWWSSSFIAKMILWGNGMAAESAATLGYQRHFFHLKQQSLYLILNCPNLPCLDNSASK